MFVEEVKLPYPIIGGSVFNIWEPMNEIIHLTLPYPSFWVSVFNIWEPMNEIIHLTLPYPSFWVSVFNCKKASIWWKERGVAIPYFLGFCFQRGNAGIVKL